jgi:hypothetical protein
MYKISRTRNSASCLDVQEIFLFCKSLVLSQREKEIKKQRVVTIHDLRKNNGICKVYSFFNTSAFVPHLLFYFVFLIYVSLQL